VPTKKESDAVGGIISEASSALAAKGVSRNTCDHMKPSRHIASRFHDDKRERNI
jgi:hypothetical protein